MSRSKEFNAEEKLDALNIMLNTLLDNGALSEGGLLSGKGKFLAHTLRVLRKQLFQNKYQTYLDSDRDHKPTGPIEYSLLDKDTFISAIRF